jgi:hypothetical protein
MQSRQLREKIMRDLLNLVIVLGTPVLIFWLIFRTVKAPKAAPGQAAE